MSFIVQETVLDLPVRIRLKQLCRFSVLADSIIMSDNVGSNLKVRHIVTCWVLRYRETVREDVYESVFYESLLDPLRRW